MKMGFSFISLSVSMLVATTAFAMTIDQKLAALPPNTELPVFVSGDPEMKILRIPTHAVAIGNPSLISAIDGASVVVSAHDQAIVSSFTDFLWNPGDLNQIRGPHGLTDEEIYLFASAIREWKRVEDQNSIVSIEIRKDASDGLVKFLRVIKQYGMEGDLLIPGSEIPLPGILPAAMTPEYYFEISLLGSGPDFVSAVQNLIIHSHH
jgi:hypothetical protein